jgi:hypothetical protein
MQTVLPPRTGTNHWGYWRVENMLDLPAGTKRRRNTVAFILTPEGLARFTQDVGTPTCCYCHQPIEADGETKPYGLYAPATKRAKLWHYPCGWGALLEDVIVHERANRILVPETIQL